MSKKARLGLLGGGAVTLLVAGFWIAGLFTPQPVGIALDLPPAGDIQAALTRMMVIQDTLLCVPGTSPDALAEILVDTSDYHPTVQEYKTILTYFGVNGLARAGYLTAKQAYYNSRLFPVHVTPPPGVIPTSPPSIYCPNPLIPPDLTFESISVAGGSKATARYAFNSDVYEAVLIKMGDKWMVAAVNMIFSHGYG